MTGKPAWKPGKNGKIAIFPVGEAVKSVENGNFPLGEAIFPLGDATFP